MSISMQANRLSISVARPAATDDGDYSIGNACPTLSSPAAADHPWVNRGGESISIGAIVPWIPAMFPGSIRPLQFA